MYCSNQNFDKEEFQCPCRMTYENPMPQEAKYGCEKPKEEECHCPKPIEKEFYRCKWCRVCRKYKYRCYPEEEYCDKKCYDDKWEKKEKKCPCQYKQESSYQQPEYEQNFGYDDGGYDCPCQKQGAPEWGA